MKWRRFDALGIGGILTVAAAITACAPEPLPGDPVPSTTSAPASDPVPTQPVPDGSGPSVPAPPVVPPYRPAVPPKVATSPPPAVAPGAPEVRVYLHQLDGGDWFAGDTSSDVAPNVGVGVSHNLGEAATVFVYLGTNTGWYQNWVKWNPANNPGQADLEALGVHYLVSFSAAVPVLGAAVATGCPTDAKRPGDCAEVVRSDDFWQVKFRHGDELEPMPSWNDAPTGESVAGGPTATVSATAQRTDQSCSWAVGLCERQPIALNAHLGAGAYDIRYSIDQDQGWLFDVGPDGESWSWWSAPAEGVEIFHSTAYSTSGQRRYIEAVRCPSAAIHYTDCGAWAEIAVPTWSVAPDPPAPVTTAGPANGLYTAAGPKPTVSAGPAQVKVSLHALTGGDWIAGDRSGAGSHKTGIGISHNIVGPNAVVWLYESERVGLLGSGSHGWRRVGAEPNAAALGVDAVVQLPFALGDGVYVTAAVATGCDVDDETPYDCAGLTRSDDMRLIQAGTAPVRTYPSFADAAPVQPFGPMPQMALSSFANPFPPGILSPDPSAYWSPFINGGVLPSDSTQVRVHFGAQHGSVFLRSSASQPTRRLAPIGTQLWSGLLSGIVDTFAVTSDVDGSRQYVQASGCPTAAVVAQECASSRPLDPVAWRWAP